ncbi:translation initiation factor IF-3 [Orientia chuto str. Dubai]|uniref:Translation initiation factor IF-3 n=1 Tax=Orientia chuto str. Dubai TaxID=1359168 RepID=A0A0F3MKJ6_9RICK|nr:translation initiation factor IF-3 [Candidatus Orientia mediorientalis]KJV56265.1 translation initiation factor IF-3 [Orientia chuto str. Dubai]
MKVNGEIKAKQVRLIDENGNMVGIVSLLEALNKAEIAGLDLVEFSQSDLPLCKILDYSKFKYEIKKKAQQAKKKQVRTSVKEIKLRPNIAAGDLAIKIRNIKQFLSKNNKVNVTVIFKGREIIHTEFGKQILDNIINACQEEGKIESFPKMQGQAITMTISPNTVKTKR